jgi:hypothetical protein
MHVMPLLFADHGRHSDYEWFDHRTPKRTPSPTPKRRPSPTKKRTPGAPARNTSHHISALRSLDAIWEPGTARILLVDLDNMRARHTRWHRRIDAIVALASQADHVILAGQKRNVAPVRARLGTYAPRVIVVAHGANLADYALLDAAHGLHPKGRRHHRPIQFAVTSNDHIFARLAGSGRLLTVVSPCTEMISAVLLRRAHSVADLRDAEGDARKTIRPARTRR